MNFFAAQERARKETRKLVLWFALCVLGVVVSMYLALVLIRHFVDFDSRALLETEPAAIYWWQPEWFMWTALIVGGMILIGSLSKLARLSGGGKVVARDLGGRQVDPSTTDLYERRLLNVVEEMAIASGMPVPDVWIMDEEQGINAFAAGTDPANAVIGVTRGTIERLTRDELQGVVAHEFSHILNGDMKLNMRLTGWIFGLVMISVVGRLLLESLRFMRGSRNSKGNGAIVAIVVLGLAVWIIGSIGVLFARILQAAISRQREFLADSSAVQFTRYPDGIAGALKKIGGFADHSKLVTAKATETRHIFFASSSLSRMLATHPPLDERIKAIDPTWNGEMLEGKADPVTADEFKGAIGFAGAGAGAAISGAATASSSAAAGPPALPVSYLQGPASKDEAKSLLFGLLLPGEAAESGRSTLAGLGHEEDAIDGALNWSRQLAGTSNAQKLAMIDHSLPWLRKMSAPEARELVATCQVLVEADSQVDLFEFMLQQVIRRHIEIGLGLEPVPSIRHRKIAHLESELADLLALFAALARDPDSLNAAIEDYREHSGRTLSPPAKPDFSRAAVALAEMDAATPLVKQQILRLCSKVATHDGRIDDQEAQLLRATAEAMGTQIPSMAQIS